MSTFLELFSKFDAARTDKTVSSSLLAFLLQQEQDLQFTSFNSEDAIALGLAILAESPRAADPSALPVVVSIIVNGHVFFYSAQDGTALDNEKWIARKVATVNRWGHSTLYQASAAWASGTTLPERFLVAKEEFAAAGGGFPLFIKGVTYPVGVISVSGLPHYIDHDVVTRGIKKFLDGKK
ncbi:hypothetical protein V1514DRAFT_327505 [Lipomyces japonicus]|uniref:uncharacterized protein n=1 Tax=Lipomyces japonicus TaxID=56871 RepID=UPI0034CE7ED5